MRMQPILKFKNIVVLKPDIKFKFRLHNCVFFNNTFKIRSYLYICFNYILKKYIICLCKI